MFKMIIFSCNVTYHLIPVAIISLSFNSKTLKPGDIKVRHQAITWTNVDVLPFEHLFYSTDHLGKQTLPKTYVPYFDAIFWLGQLKCTLRINS